MAPIETLTDFLRPASSLLPLTYAIIAMIEIFLGDVTIRDILLPLGILGLSALMNIY